MFKKILKSIFFTFLILVLWKVFFHSSLRDINFDNQEKYVTFRDNNLEYRLKTRANTVDNFLGEQKITLGEHDQLLPEKNSPLLPGSVIEIKRAVKIKITADGKSIENYTLTNDISTVLAENNITLSRLDKTTPDKNSLIANNLEIIVTRINIEEKVIPEDIPFKTTTKLDSTLGWREKKTQQAGVNGTVEVKYKITYKNNQEISRVALERNTIKQPTPEIDVQGTLVKTGKANAGQGTWYAFKGGLFAASTTIPMGGYAKVTNSANGKSVMVQINDYGPQGKGRIIDLDKVAFQKIASIGAGVIGVKVEEVLN